MAKWSVSFNNSRRAQDEFRSCGRINLEFAFEDDHELACRLAMTCAFPTSRMGHAILRHHTSEGGLRLTFTLCVFASTRAGVPGRCGSDRNAAPIRSTNRN